MYNDTNTILAIASAVTALLGGGLILLVLVYQRHIRKKYILEKSQTTYHTRLQELIKNLNYTAEEADKIILELTELTQERERKLSLLEHELLQMEERETQIRRRIDDLETVPIAAVEYFAKLASVGEKRSAKRDYFLFALGVVVSLLSAIVLKFFGLG